MYKPRFKGKHYEMGHHYGKLLRKNGVVFNPLLDFDASRLRMGTDSLNICKEVYPEIIEEVKGMADGLKVDFLLFGTFLITAGAYSFDVGCSTFAYVENKDVYFVRNHDMFVSLKKTTESALYKPHKGYSFLGHGDGLIGKEDGMNVHGLAVGMTFVAPKTISPGLNFLFIVRLLLEKCKNVNECIEYLKNIPTMTSQSIVLADVLGRLAVVEMCPEHMAVRYPKPGERFIVATNHFIEKEMKEFDCKPEENWYSTLDRYDTVTKNLQSGRNYSRELGIEIASGKRGFLCQYNKNLSFDTLWSVSYHLNTLSIKRAEGNPRRAKYKIDYRLEKLKNELL